MNEIAKHDAYVGTAEAARLLGITRQAVLKRIKAGTLLARRIGSRYVIPIAELRSPLVSDPVLADIVDRLVRGYDPERVYLFGSAAQGDAGPDSDYDIMLVVSENAEVERRRPYLAYKGMLRGVPAPVDVLVMTRERFDRKSTVIGSLPEIILYEGKLLYAP